MKKFKGKTKCHLGLYVNISSSRLYRRVKYLIEDKAGHDISHADFFSMMFDSVLLEHANEKIKLDYKERKEKEKE